jgi:BirA family transcriptional regulator, biotin operon repressor / biotin---[acetyl-CoA-carboxylase] ligase
MRFSVRKLDITSSTNDDVKTAARKGAEAGLVVWALKQSAGRGRLGRPWQSPEGNLYASVLFRPAWPMRLWGCYSFAACVAVAESLKALLPARKVEIKWPNDVLVEGKKISGILLEAETGALIAGLGLNVRHGPEKPLYPATSLKAEGATELDLEKILSVLLESLGAWADRLEAQGFSPVREAWLSLARKGKMRVRLPGGEGEVEGEFAGLDDEGGLRLRLADGAERAISAGDVLFA